MLKLIIAIFVADWLFHVTMAAARTLYRRLGIVTKGTLRHGR